MNSALFGDLVAVVRAPWSPLPWVMVLVSFAKPTSLVPHGPMYCACGPSSGCVTQCAMPLLPPAPPSLCASGPSECGSFFPYFRCTTPPAPLQGDSHLVTVPSPPGVGLEMGGGVSAVDPLTLLNASSRFMTLLFCWQMRLTFGVALTHRAIRFSAEDPWELGGSHGTESEKFFLDIGLRTLCRVCTRQALGCRLPCDQ